MLTDYHVHLRPDEDGTTPERYFTAANAERYRETASRRGIEELGVAEHIHRFTQSLDVWAPLVPALGPRRPRRLLRLRPRGHRPAARHRGRLPARARGPARQPARRAPLGLRGRLAPLPARRGGGPPRLPGLGAWDIWRSHDPEKVWARYFETLGEAAAAASSTSWPIPTWSRSGAPACRGPTAICAASTSAPWTASPSPTWRSRCPRRGCASRSRRSTRRGLPRALPGGRPAGGAVERRPPAGAAGPRVRARRGVAEGPRRDRAGRLRGAASALEPLG